MFFAHSRPGEPQSDWDPLNTHLERTALRAKLFFPAAPDWAYLAGLWHDAGKYQKEFQTYLTASNEESNEQRPVKVKHSIVGAALAGQQKDSVSLALAWVIAAHHGSLADRPSLVKKVHSEGVPRLEECQANIPDHIFNAPRPPAVANSVLNTSSGAASVWIRMLFSALVDADLLDTEAWSSGGERPNTYLPVDELRERLDAFLHANSRRLESLGLHDAPINRMRSRVLADCLQAASLAPGQFTLTVPTGGGKTLSSMAFALHHACQHHLERVIVVIPYTSIIEQTAEVYRGVLGAENIVEHHSSIDLDTQSLAHQRACENWDAPIIVTTSVQFFESLYAARKSRCRKLHRIANSVVILDEVQTFPIGLLAPIRRVLGLLTQHFGTSVLHCTATQPTPEKGQIIGPPIAPEPRPIVTHPEPYFAVVANRFRVLIEGNIDHPLHLEELAERIVQYPRVMAIVHNRKDAERLARSVDGCIHLSARMCAAHRKDVLDQLRERLKAKQPCRLVATQLVEAGVDISFPVVFRALAGLETLAQAAGRCNRELDGEQPGEFHIFRAASQPPSNSLRRQLAIGMAFLRRPGFELDLNSPNLFQEYFRAVLDPHTISTDAPGVSTLEREMDFPETEARFHMIDSTGASVVAPYRDWKNRVASVRWEGPTRRNLRSLQRYVVQLYDREIDDLLRNGLIEPLYKDADRLWAVRDGANYIYSDAFGFGWQGTKTPEPETMIA